MNRLHTICFLLFLSGCGFVQSSSSRGNTKGSDLTDSAQAFSTEIYPLLLEHCSECHSQLQAPFFAIRDDIQNSHDNTIEANLVNFTAPTESRLVTKLQGIHNCWTNDCDDDAATMLQAIQNWSDVRNSDDQQGGLATNELVVPSAVEQSACPTAANQVPTDMMEFDLKTAVSSLPDDTVLQIRICKFDDFSYYVADPLIISEVALVVEGLHVYVNGIEARPGNSFTEIEWIVEPSESGDRIYTVTGNPGDLLFRPLNILVGLGLGLESGGGPGEDKILLRFDRLEAI